MRPYSLGAAPLVAAAQRSIPSRARMRSMSAPFFGYARAFALDSSAPDTGKVTTRWTRSCAGARVRARTGSEASPIVGLVGAYGEESFALFAATGAALPGVDYRFLRASVDVQIPMGRVRLLAAAAYLFVLSAGDVAGRFPKASVGGAEGELGGAIAIAAGLEARVTASYRRFFYSMHPTPGDNYVAGGALDELGGVQAGVAYVY